MNHRTIDTLNKVAIITIVGRENIGNRLQNYAVGEGY